MVDFGPKKRASNRLKTLIEEKAECVHTVCVDGGIRKTSKWICADRSRFDHNENDHTLSGDFHRQDQRRAQ